ncbi:MAG: hypothetical protein OXP12_09950 [Thaumarchaeota archaeon]|nr:hypothetical protein [Nitrososphaerota archaeon]
MVVRRVFIGSGLNIDEPTRLSVPLSFNEGELFFYSDRDREETEEALLQFIDDFVVPRTDRVLMWEEETDEGVMINIGTIVIKDNVPQLHYVSVGVGI